MSAKKVVIIEGEDAAPEAVRPTINLIDRLGVEIEWLRPPVGEEGLARCGSLFPDECRLAIDSSDATLFGATNGKSAPALFYLRWGKATYANVRPTRWIPGYKSPLRSPEGIDFVIIRENLEDLYVGVEGDLEALKPLGLESKRLGHEVADLAPGRFALKVFTKAGVERVVRFGFELARRRKLNGHRGKVTVASKYNVLPRSDGFFQEVAERVAESYPDITYETFLADDFARRIVASPHDLDVVVLPNMYGDILSDEASGIIGGLGLAPSGCYGNDYAYFESVHGSAPDIAGKNVINPTATILSAVMMLEYLGFGDQARKLETAVEMVYAEGKHLTPDQGGAATTTEFCEAVERKLSE
jgi:isocitrate/isopropylmalate dehydrogenase